MPLFCCDCGAQVDEKLEAIEGRQPCAAYGSTKRRVYESLADGFLMGADMHTKGYAGSVSRKKRLKFESKDGDSMSTARGRFMKRHQLVDKENNRYVKKVIDPSTGRFYGTWMSLSRTIQAVDPQRRMTPNLQLLPTRYPRHRADRSNPVGQLFLKQFDIAATRIAIKKTFLPVFVGGLPWLRRNHPDMLQTETILGAMPVERSG